MQLQWDKFLAAIYSLIKPTRLTKKLFPIILETIIGKLLVYSDGKKMNLKLEETIDFCSTSKGSNMPFCRNTCRQKH